MKFAEQYDTSFKVGAPEEIHRSFILLAAPEEIHHSLKMPERSSKVIYYAIVWVIQQRMIGVVKLCFSMMGLYESRRLALRTQPQFNKTAISFGMG